MASFVRECGAVGGRWGSLILVIVGLGMPISALTAERDRHAGYYYPIPATAEVYEARSVTLPDSTRKRRVLFVTELTNQMMDSPYPPPFALFAKGEDAQKMIITALYDGAYNSVYRMRGLLAQLTARARATPIFRDNEVEDRYTFFDLLKLLGFTRLTVTDGRSFAHRIQIR